MLSWLRPLVRIKKIDAEAEALIQELGGDAYAEARRKASESSSASIARDWGRVAQAISKRTSLDAAPPISIDADVAHSGPITALGHRAKSELSLPDQLNRSVSPPPQQFRVQFVGVAGGCESLILKEVGIESVDVSGAIVAAAGLALPPRTSGVRILDREGREVFARQKAGSPASLGPTEAETSLSLGNRVRRGLNAADVARVGFSELRRWALSLWRTVVQASVPFLGDVRNWRRSLQDG
jgi:hypothetical protein